MIVFLGDSFTWGQGLYSKKWIEEGKSIEYCNNNMPPGFSHENISYSDDAYRRKYHFPSLVAKHYNRSYYTMPKNGGSNFRIYNVAKNINDLSNDNGIDFVIVQFTEFTRYIDYKIPIEFPRDNNLENIDDIIHDICKNQVKLVYDALKENKIKNFLFFSWRPDISDVIKKYYNDHHIPIFYKGVTYDFLEFMLNKNQELELRGDIGVDDGHLSELGHSVIAESIIKKVDTMGINFIRPK